MNNTGRNQRSSYLVALLLMVGLAAFSNSMRELAEIHQFTLNAGSVIAQFAAPAEIPEVPQTPELPQVVVAKFESCNSKQADELPWLEDVEGITEPGAAAVTVPVRQVGVERAERRVRVKPTEVQLAKLNKFRQFDFEPGQFEFRVSTTDNDDSTLSLAPVTIFKAKNRKHNVIRFNPRDREILLKTLNRSINLRTAS